jgi:hypothetical protein
MQGSCHCGHVVFRAEPPVRDVIACHCTQCRKVSGHYWAAASVPHDRLHLLRDDGLVWFQSSDAARRAFCKDCGAALFWDPTDGDHISFAAGAVEGATGLRIESHWFTEDAGDYYSPEGSPPEPTATHTLTGSCLCGQCCFSLPGPAGAITACHCDQCRKLSGHYSASFDADESAVNWQARATLAEYTTPGGGRRGFCTTCGSSLYFRAKDGAFSIEAGAIDGPTGGTLADHIFTAEKGDYYDLADDLPQR